MCVNYENMCSPSWVKIDISWIQLCPDKSDRTLQFRSLLTGCTKDPLRPAKFEKSGPYGPAIY
jgi:hypothetical protein